MKNSEDGGRAFGGNDAGYDSAGDHGNDDWCSNYD